jgi:hypothetical protein
MAANIADAASKIIDAASKCMDISAKDLEQLQTIQRKLLARPQTPPPPKPPATQRPTATYREHRMRQQQHRDNGRGPENNRDMNRRRYTPPEGTPMPPRTVLQRSRSRSNPGYCTNQTSYNGRWEDDVSPEPRRRSPAAYPPAAYPPAAYPPAAYPPAAYPPAPSELRRRSPATRSSAASEPRRRSPAARYSAPREYRCYSPAARQPIKSRIGPRTPPTPQKSKSRRNRHASTQAQRRLPASHRKKGAENPREKEVSRAQLQSYYEDRPGKPHPTNAELDALKDGEKITVQRIIYHKKGNKVVVLGRFLHHSDEIHPGSKAVVVPTKPVLPMSNLRNKDELPEVDEALPERLKRHSKLFSAPEQLRNKEHRNNGTDCHCAPTAFDYHALNFTQSVCMKKDKVEIEKTELKTEFSADKTEPHRRPHLYSEKSRKPVLLCPVPFLNQIPWEPKVYLPVNATEPPSKRQDLFYALFDEKRYKEAIKPYLSEPQTWDDSIHPFYKEPDSQDELSLWTKGT